MPQPITKALFPPQYRMPEWLKIHSADYYASDAGSPQAVDDSGGQAVSLPTRPTRAGIRCFVELLGQEPTEEYGRSSVTNKYKIHCDPVPGVRPPRRFDRFLWTVGRVTHTLTVDVTVDEAMAGIHWTISCYEKGDLQ